MAEEEEEGIEATRLEEESAEVAEVDVLRGILGMLLRPAIRCSTAAATITHP